MQRLTETLLAEHRDLRQALAVLAAIGRAVQRGREFPTSDCALLLRYFREFLVGVHFAKEGNHLLPAVALRGDDRTAELAGAVLRAQEQAMSLLHSLILFWEPLGELAPAEREGFAATVAAFVSCLMRGMELEEQHLFSAAELVPVDDRLGWPVEFTRLEAERRSSADWRRDLAELGIRWLH